MHNGISVILCQDICLILLCNVHFLSYPFSQIYIDVHEFYHKKPKRTASGSLKFAFEPAIASKQRPRDLTWTELFDIIIEVIGKGLGYG